MKRVIIPRLEALDHASIEYAGNLLENEGKREALDTLNWPREFPYHPITTFNIGYSPTAIYIKYDVHGSMLRAIYTNDQEPVYEDSCVEFFVKPAGAERYFNFEMNCGGTILLYHVRNCRAGDYTPVPEADLATIERFHTLPERVPEEITDPVTWRLGFRIPIAFFVKYSKINPNLSGQKWTANFTKCADHTSHPHWISWQALPKCDFHQPDHFGELLFE